MKLQDTLYGKHSIDSPLIRELINSSPLQRLRKISQYGIPDEFYHLKNTTRYDHSLGVMLLLRRLGADEEEQVAGLLHDVSHTAFSHLVDWISGSGETEDYQDRQHVGYILNSELAMILRKYGLDPLKIANHENYSLLEKEIPDLCADRIDYSIKEYPPNLAEKCLSGLIVYRKKIVFDDLGKAKLFAYEFLRRQKVHWGGDEAVCRYILFGDVLKRALADEIIDFDDLWTYDEYVVNRLKASKNNHILAVLNLLKTNKKIADLKRTKQTVKKKFRYVDPLILIGTKLKRLSNLDSGFKKQLESAIRENRKGVRVPIVEI